MEDAVEDEIRLLSRFEKHDEFLELQNGLLSLDPLVELCAEESRREDVLMQSLSLIFDEYQEQSYLLDPFLEKLVVPVAEKLKQHARVLVSTPHKPSSFTRLSRISTLLYYYIKCRGYKAIVRYFPHEIADLSIALQFSQTLDAVKDTSIWSLRYVTLLWLSLICMIPFDLAQFDETGQVGQTALAIETVAKSHLGKAGLEREGATVLLSRLLVRKDTHAQRTTFLAWSCSSLGQDYELFQVLGILQSLCSIAKICPSDLVADQIPDFLNAAQLCAQNVTLAANTLVRRYRVKLLARSALRLLPGRTRFRPHKARIFRLAEDKSAELNDDDDSDMIPDEIEAIIQDLIGALQDRDTVVRWSAAKGIARIAERLPADFAEQVLETAMDLFTIHSIAVASLYDMPAVAESTWHGACLACGEMARRDLISDEKIKELIAWMSKALYFDIRKGAHSIGSSVRDAAAYVLWSLARIPSQDVLKPFANGLAQDLLRVSLYDREIHIRRAASATFQEYVGRTGLFPHGIDVLPHTDFFAVAVRRNAFLIAARDVAVHEEYRQALVDHVLNITLRHWDASMRSLGAESLRKMCELDLQRLGPTCMEQAHKLLRTEESSDIHGALVALAQLADAFSHSPDDVELQGHRRKIFSLLEEVPLGALRAPHNELLAAAACYLIANSVSVEDVKLELRYQSSEPFWLSVISIGLNHRSMVVQEAATAAMAQVSKLVDCSSMVNRLIQEFRTGTPSMQQSLARLLGRLDYSAHPHGLHEAIQCLISSVDKSPLTRMMNVDSRRNCYVSLPQILNTVAHDLISFLQPDTVSKMFAALLAGLEDYTMDERGDVGSWIRIACIQGLTVFTCMLFTHSSQIPQFSEYLSSSQYHAAVAGILKQGVERLDNVRQEAGACLQKLLEQPPPSVVKVDAWCVHQGDLIRRLFFSDGDGVSEWQSGAWLFPRAVQLLDISHYRQDVLSGLLLSINSKTSSTQRPVRNSLVAYGRKLPVADAESGYSLCNLTHDLIKHARVNLQSNYIVIPVLQTFNVLLDADILDGLTDDPHGLQSLRTLFVISSSNVRKLKNVQRLQSSMNIVVRLLTFTELFQDSLVRLVEFLTHPYPKIRSDTAESLYLLLQTRDIATDTSEAESLLLETEWFSSDVTMLQETARKLVTALSS